MKEHICCFPEWDQYYVQLISASAWKRVQRQLLTNSFGIVLNETLEVLLSVLLWLKNNNIAFWEEIPKQKSVETGQYRKCIKRLDVLSTVQHQQTGKDDPGEDQ